MPLYYDFKITLNHTSPQIWRRFLLHSDATFGDLHQAIQDSFGWKSAHLSQFSKKAWQEVIAEFYPQQTDWGDESNAADYDTPLSTYFDHHQRCVYTYDFGDDWEHLVLCHKRRPELEEVFLRRLLAGEHAGAPEDCGGAYGLEELLQWHQTPAGKLTQEQRERLHWYTSDGWPEPFVLDEMKQRFDTQDVSRSYASSLLGLEPIDWDEFDPKLRQVCDVLREVMPTFGETPDDVAYALDMWEEFVQVGRPKPRKPAIYAASMHYLLCQLDQKGHTQADIAKAYATSASSISQTYPRMHEVLIDHFAFAGLMGDDLSIDPHEVLEMLKGMPEFPEDEGGMLGFVQSLLSGQVNPHWEAFSEQSDEGMEEATKDYIMALLTGFANSNTYKEALAFRDHIPQGAYVFIDYMIKTFGCDPFKATWHQLQNALFFLNDVLGQSLEFDPPSQQRELVALFTYVQRELGVEIPDTIIDGLKSPDTLSVLEQAPTMFWDAPFDPQTTKKKKKGAKKKAKAKRKQAKASRKKNKRK